METLTFKSIDGIYLADAPINGEARAFGAKIVREGGRWYLTTYTYSQPLTAGWWPTLNRAKEEARLTYSNIESVNH